MGSFRGCTCLKCTNKARCATTEQVGALETSAPPEGSICENLCNLWENIQQKGSVYSANSVGEYTARRVQSVGGISQQEEIIIKKQNRKYDT